jgi:hypothetical protein
MKSGCYGHSNFQRGDYNRCMMVSSSNNQHTTPALFPSARVANNTIVASNRTSSSSSIAEGGFSTFSSSSSFEDDMGSIAPIHDIARLTNITAHQQQDYNSSALPSSYSSFRGRNINGDSSHLLGPMIGLSGARRRSHQYVNEQPFSVRKLAYEEAKRLLFQQHQHQKLRK